MNRYRTIPGLGPPKASSATTCQKCLKKDSYECKATVQERPYASRPSRSQQLFNPKLAPKLTSDTSNQLLTSQGVADKQLAEAAEQRNGHHARRSASPIDTVSLRERPRSASASSVDSVSTISTNKSRSPSPPPSKDVGEDRRPRARGRRSSSSSSPDSRGLKRKRSSMSTSSRSRSPPPHPRSQRKNRRHRTISPDDRGRPSSLRRGSRRSRSTSASADKSQITKHRRSLDDNQDAPNGSTRQSDHRRGEKMPDRRYERLGRPDGEAHGGRNVRREQRRERSLSPYSRRLALTQAMNVGR